MFTRQRTFHWIFRGTAAIALILASLPPLAAGLVKEYGPVVIPCSPVRGNAKLLAIRRFIMENSEMYLVVDGHSLRTSITKAGDLLFTIPWPGIPSFSPDFPPYFAALGEATGPPYPVQNQGLRHFGRDLGGSVLSVDLCPSKRPLTRSIFTDLIAAFSRHPGPVPVTIAVSGAWLDTHQRDLDWLRSLESAGKLDITWVNHSYSHPREFRPRPRDLRKGFLLGKNVDIEREILKAEENMIEKGLTPSVFVRFPGLVSDRKIVEKVRSWGLIPLGADAWLAKRERPRGGSIILIHGNGHEPVGVARMRALLSERRRQIERGDWRVLDLRDCAAGIVRRWVLPANKRQKVASGDVNGSAFPGTPSRRYLPGMTLSSCRRTRLSSFPCCTAQAPC